MFLYVIFFLYKSTNLLIFIIKNYLNVNVLILCINLKLKMKLTFYSKSLLNY